MKRTKGPVLLLKCVDKVVSKVQRNGQRGKLRLTEGQLKNAAKKASKDA